MNPAPLDNSTEETGDDNTTSENDTEDLNNGTDSSGDVRRRVLRFRRFPNRRILSEDNTSNETMDDENNTNVDTNDTSDPYDT